MSAPATAQHRLVLERLPSVAPGSPLAWGRAVAVIAAWPAGEPARPTLERRFWRNSHRGALVETLVASVSDPLGMLTADDARAELSELARPLRTALALRPASSASVTKLDALPFSHLAELWRIDHAGPESGALSAELFTDLVSGIEQMPCAVALSLLVAPGQASGDDGEGEDGGDENAARGVTFRLRLASARPVPAAIRARAESLCRAGTTDPDCWTVAAGPSARDAFKASLRSHQPVAGPSSDRQASAVVAATTIGLPGPERVAKTLVGRPVPGRLAPSGATLGQVPRPTGRLVPWRLDWPTRAHHVLITGGTGAGKTTMISRLALDDLETGRGLILVDPHGDLAHGLESVLGGRAGTLYVDPRRDATRPLDLLHPDPRRADAAIQSAMRELWPVEFSGPVFQRHVSIALRLLAAGNQPLTMTSLDRYFADPEIRGRLHRCADAPLQSEAAPVLKAMLRPSNDDSSVVNWLASKFSPLAQGPARELFDRADPVTWEDRIARGDACVICIPTGIAGDAGARMAGRMLITRITQALAAQSARNEDDRHPCSVIVDEAHLFAGPALAALFAQVRKFGGSLTVATQAPSQLGAYRDVILTNAQTMISGRISRVEAEALRDRAGAATAELMPRLPRRHMVVVGEEHDCEQVAPVLTPVPLPTTSTAQHAVAARAERLAEDPEPTARPELPIVPDEPGDAESRDSGTSVVDAILARRLPERQQATLVGRSAVG